MECQRRVRLLTARGASTSSPALRADRRSPPDFFRALLTAESGFPLRRAALAGALALFPSAGAPAAGQTGAITREEALANAFPGAEVAADRVYLTEEQAKRIGDEAGGPLPTRIYARYVARRGGEVVGRAYGDTHVVRTKRETLLVVLTADGRIRRIEVTAFLEPRIYLPPERWLAQYEEESLDDDLAVHRAIRPIAGATLTTLAVNAAVRRVLALDRLLQDESPKPR